MTPPSQMSDSVTITATVDNLFEDTEKLQVMISDISSPYATCTECTTDIVFDQNPSDSKLISEIHIYIYLYAVLLCV